MRHAIIKTAGPLSEQDQAVLKRRFEALLSEEITVEYEEDASLIAGFAAYIDGKLYDMSALTKLQDIKKALEAQQEARVDEAAKERSEEPPQKAWETAEAEVASSIGTFLRQKLKEVETGARVYSYGTVQNCSDGIVRVDGLSESLYGELLEFENDAFGMALELTEHGVGAVLFAGADEVYAGSIVRGTGRVLDIGVGKELLGRVVDPLGRPLDGRPLQVKQQRPLECPAPSIVDRAPVSQSLQTGILAIDSMIPIGKGQRELIIGDRQMGKSVIALSAMLNQSRKGVICVYCAIGQKASTVAQFMQTLASRGAMENCVVVVSTASDSAAMQYITPYAGCAIAETFMYAGRDVLIVYDDLSKHATSYRTMSLLLRRPPGREAYPGDVFYLHSRLLERAAKLSAEMGGGSMTALPIVETMAGDISAYIPTNVISITDGQIYLESELFHSGVRPAVNVGLSVSRVGRAAQPPAMRKVSGQLRLNLAQYREMAVFAQFDSDIDTATKALLAQGERLTELLKQDQNTIYTLSEQVAILFAYAEHLFDAIEVKDVVAVKTALCEFLWQNDKGLMSAIDRTDDLSEADKTALKGAIAEFKKTLPARKE